MIYLDNAATSYPKPEAVYQATSDCLRNCSGSPGRGGYGFARAAGQILFQAREELAVLFGAKNPGTIMFTYNATDAINTALFGVLRQGDRVITSSMEHNAVARPLKELESRGVELIVIPCDAAGRLKLDDMRAVLGSGARAVVISHGSNVVGTLMPLGEIGQLAASVGALFIVDAAQTAGVEEINVESLGIDLLAFSGHKGLFGPQGTGGLYVREGLNVVPLRYGGTGSQSELSTQPTFYPDRLESGTPNTPGIAGLSAGIRFIRETGQTKIRAVEKGLTTELLCGLGEIPNVRVFGPGATEARTAVVSFTMTGIDCGEVAFRLDQEFGIACRSGLHCAPWAHQTIGTLESGTIRLSPGYFNTAADIDETVRAVRIISMGRV